MGADPSAWEIGAASAQVVAAIAAVLGLVFVGLQLCASRRSIDLQTLQDFTQRVAEREAAFHVAQNDDQKNRVFIEFLNFLESNAAAFNANLFPKTSRAIVRDSLINSLAAIQSEQEWHDKLAAAVQSESTFDELLKFVTTERQSISAVADGFNRLKRSKT